MCKGCVRAVNDVVIRREVVLLLAVHRESGSESVELLEGRSVGPLRAWRWLCGCRFSQSINLAHHTTASLSFYQN